MARVKRGTKRRARRKKLLRRTKGFFLTKSKLYQSMQEAANRADRYAYRDRRNRKRDFRALWIQRINAGARQHGLTYSQFMHGIKLAGLDLDDDALKASCEQSIRNHDPCISCAAHFLRLQVHRT